jgi:hypothetical protein
MTRRKLTRAKEMDAQKMGPSGRQGKEEKVAAFGKN